MSSMNREDRDMIAKALMAYKAELKKEATEDLKEYNQAEVANVDDMAKRLEFDDHDYYQMERGKASTPITPDEIDGIISPFNNERTVAAAQAAAKAIHESWEIITHTEQDISRWTGREIHFHNSSALFLELASNYKKHEQDGEYEGPDDNTVWEYLKTSLNPDWFDQR